MISVRFILWSVLFCCVLLQFQVSGFMLPLVKLPFLSIMVAFSLSMVVVQAYVHQLLPVQPVLVSSDYQCDTSSSDSTILANLVQSYPEISSQRILQDFLPFTSFFFSNLLLFEKFSCVLLIFTWSSILGSYCRLFSLTYMAINVIGMVAIWLYCLIAYYSINLGLFAHLNWLRDCKRLLHLVICLSCFTLVGTIAVFLNR